MKTCTRCGVNKSLDAFHKWNRGLDGRRGYCKQCSKAYNQGYRVGKTIEIARYQRNYRAINAERLAVDARFRTLERLARKKSLPSERVTVRNVALRDGSWCWLCGDELSDFDPSHMDHLIPLAADPELLVIWGIENPGTVLANMALACPSCNIRKSNKILPCAIARYLRNLEPIEAAA